MALGGVGPLDSHDGDDGVLKISWNYGITGLETGNMFDDEQFLQPGFPSFSRS